MRALNYCVLADGIFAIAMVGLAAARPPQCIRPRSIPHSAGQKFIRHPRAARHDHCGSGDSRPLLRRRWRQGCAVWVAVGGEGFGWSGGAKVRSKQEWPDWYPTGDILVRHPELRTGIKQLPSAKVSPAALIARWAPARSISGKATRTRCTGSMAQTSHGRSAATFLPVASACSTTT